METRTEEREQNIHSSHPWPPSCSLWCLAASYNPEISRWSKPTISRARFGHPFEQRVPTAPPIMEAYNLAEGQFDPSKIGNCMRGCSKNQLSTSKSFLHEDKLELNMEVHSSCVWINFSGIPRENCLVSPRFCGFCVVRRYR